MSDAARDPSGWRPLAIVAAAVFVLTVIVNLPASLLAGPLGASGVLFQSVDGTLWSGVVRGASLRGVPLGDVAYRTRPAALLTGRLAADVDMRGGAVRADGMLSVGVDRIAIRSANFAVDLNRIDRFLLMGAPLEGSGRAEIVSFVYTRAGCRAAEMQVWTDALTGPARRLSRRAFDLAGEGRCDGGDFVLTLAGSGEEGGATLALRLKPGLSYELQAAATPARADLARMLVGIGFEEGDGALTYASTGRLRRAGS